MEPERSQSASLFPSVAAQLRGALSNLYLAAALTCHSLSIIPSFLAGNCDCVI